MDCVGVSRHAIMQSLTTMHAQTGNILSVCMPIHSLLLYPLDTPRNPASSGGYCMLRRKWNNRACQHANNKEWWVWLHPTLYGNIWRFWETTSEDRILFLPLARNLPLWAELRWDKQTGNTSTDCVRLRFMSLMIIIKLYLHSTSYKNIQCNVLHKKTQKRQIKEILKWIVNKWQ